MKRTRRGFIETSAAASALLGVGAVTACLFAQSTQETEVRRLLADFLSAFSNLDWPAFRQLWIDNPVVFFPSVAVNSTGRRIDDPVDFERAWHRQFDLIREAAAKRGVTNAPFQKIEVRDVRVDFPAPTVAVVTFHVGPEGNVLARRMFVIVKTTAGWKISHVTASNLSLTTP